MARILGNLKSRRTIQLNTDEIIGIVREYQRINAIFNDYEKVRAFLNKTPIFLPEDY